MDIQELIDELLKVPEDKRGTDVVLKSEDGDRYIINYLEELGFNINNKIFILEGKNYANKSSQ